jgi:hypothetical protein
MDKGLLMKSFQEFEQLLRPQLTLGSKLGLIVTAD